jgi:hypothetical protein
MRIGSEEENAPVVQQMEKAPSKKLRLVKIFGRIKRVLPTTVLLVFFTSKINKKAPEGASKRPKKAI